MLAASRPWARVLAGGASGANSSGFRSRGATVAASLTRTLSTGSHRTAAGGPMNYSPAAAFSSAEAPLVALPAQLTVALERTRAGGQRGLPRAARDSDELSNLAWAVGARVAVSKVGADLQVLAQPWTVHVPSEVLVQASQARREQQAVLDGLLAQAQRSSTKIALGSVGFFTAEAAFMWWGTYHAFSWDITEPMAYFLGAVDVIALYAYFALVKEDYSAGNMRDTFVRRKLRQVKAQAVAEGRYVGDETMVRLIELDELMQHREEVCP